MKMKYAIIENEQYAREYLISVIKKLRPDYELVFEGESIEETVRFAQSPEFSEVDLVFMDIELNDGNCFSIFGMSSFDVPVIFTTAYDEYALRAFKVNSIDYLLKPLKPGELEDALGRFEKRNPKAPVPDYRVLTASPRERVLTVSGDTYSYVDINDVAWFVSEDKYIYLTLHNGKTRMTDFQNLQEACENLDPRRFFQIARNMVVNISAVKKVVKHFNGRLKTIVEAGEQVKETYVSAARRREFLDWLGGNA